MSGGFDVDFDMSTDEVKKLLKEYKKIKKYQKSKMIEEAKEEGFGS
jgi:hypothetical protein